MLLGLLTPIADDDRNRSKFQPRGHFDAAAVGGRRRPQKAGTGSALELLRQRRLQQVAASGDNQHGSYMLTKSEACPAVM